MALKLGNTDIKDVRLGETEVQKVYLGNILVWERASGFPAGYTKLEFLESNGTQWIELPYLPNNLSGVEVDFILTQKVGTGNMPIFGARTTTTSASFSLWAFNTNVFRTDFNNSVISSTSYQLDTRYLVFENKNLFFVNGDLKVTHPNSSFTTSNTLLLFSTRLRGTNPNGYMKLFSARVWDNDILIYDLKPAKRNSDGVVGLLDVLNNEFYTNAGTGTFLYN